MPIEAHQAWEQPEVHEIEYDLVTDAELFQAINDFDLGNKCIAISPATSLGRSINPEPIEGKESSLVVRIDALKITTEERTFMGTSFCGFLSKGGRKMLLAMNSQWIGGWNLGRRAHPNDGKLDVVEWNLGIFEWYKVRKRLPTGSFAPHPHIKESRKAKVEFDVLKGQKLIVDGGQFSDKGRVVVEVIPDYLTVAIA